MNAQNLSLLASGAGIGAHLVLLAWWLTFLNQDRPRTNPAKSTD